MAKKFLGWMKCGHQNKSLCARLGARLRKVELTELFFFITKIIYMSATVVRDEYQFYMAQTARARTHIFFSSAFSLCVTCKLCLHLELMYFEFNQLSFQQKWNLPFRWKTPFFHSHTRHNCPTQKNISALLSARNTDKKNTQIFHNTAYRKIENCIQISCGVSQMNKKKNLN